MRTLTIVTCFMLLASLSAFAQEDGERPRRRGGDAQPRGRGATVGPLLAVAADKDHDNTVTKAEWDGFVGSLQSEKGLNGDKLKSLLFVAALDQNYNGKLEVSDIEAGFKVMDRNGDGALQAEEVGPQRRARRGGEGGGRGGEGGGRGGEGGGGGLQSAQDQDDKDKKEGEGDARERRRGGQGRQQPGNRMSPVARFQRTAMTGVVAAADGDKSGDVTAEEWSGFVKDLGAGGVVAEGKISALMGSEAAAGEGGARGRGGFGFGRMIDFGLGLGRDGELTEGTLDEIFAQLDRNDDDKLDGDEMPARPAVEGAEKKQSDKVY